MFFAFFLLAFAMETGAADEGKRWEIDLEGGGVFSGYNDVQIPNVTGTRFSLSEDLNTPDKVYFRLRATYKFNSRHHVSVLFAPLTLKASGVLEKAVFFEDTLFPAFSEVDGVFKFNSYRLTYRYNFLRKEKIRLGIGFTAKIRDARVALASSSEETENTNVGFVPLLHFTLDWNFAEKWALKFEVDAAAAKQGRAEDVLLALLYQIGDNAWLKIGYRLVEGGADVDEVYTFAWINYAAAGIIFQF
jgi:hypothetical protein